MQHQNTALAVATEQALIPQERRTCLMYIRPYDTYDEQGRPVYNHHGGFTIAFSIEETGEVVFSFSHCSRKDRFTKSIGRKIAEGRLLTSDMRSRNLHTVYVGTTRPRPSELRAEFMEYLSQINKKYRKEIRLCREE